MYMACMTCSAYLKKVTLSDYVYQLRALTRHAGYKGTKRMFCVCSLEIADISVEN